MYRWGRGTVLHANETADWRLFLLLVGITKPTGDTSDMGPTVEQRCAKPVSRLPIVASLGLPANVKNTGS